MGIFLAIIPFLQALSAICTIWGFAHTVPATETTVSYGLYGVDNEQGLTAAQAMNSFGATAIGLIGLVSTWVAKSKSGATEEIVVALVAFIANRKDPTNWRRFLMALIDLLDEIYGNKITPDEQTAIEYVKTWLAGKAIAAKTDPAVVGKA